MEEYKILIAADIDSLPFKKRKQLLVFFKVTRTEHTKQKSHAFMTVGTPLASYLA